VHDLRDRLVPDRAAFDNYVAAGRDMAAGRTVVEARPSHVRLEVTTYCNLRCVQCGIDTYPLANRHLERVVLDRLEQEVFPTTAFVQYADQGEPLLYPHLEHALALQRRHDIPSTKLITNGMLLDEAKSRLLLASGLTELAVSLDGATPETYERIRRGARFDRVLGNVARFRELRDAAGETRPRITFIAVALRDVMDELEGIVHLAAEHGASRMELRRLQNALGQDCTAHSIQDRARARRGLERAMNAARQHGILLWHNLDMDMAEAPAVPAPTGSETDETDDRFYLGDLTLVAVPDHYYRDSRVKLEVSVHNRSPFPWHSSFCPTSSSAINVSYRVLSADGQKVLVRDGQRTPLPSTVHPGETRCFPVRVQLPDQAGRMVLELDLVNEGERWFEIRRRTPITVENEIVIESAPETGSRCPYPWRYVAVKVNGDVCPCRFTSFAMGNLTTQNFATIWNSSSYQNLRRSILEDRASFCQGVPCPYVQAGPGELRYEMELREPPRPLPPDREVTIPVRVWNRGRQTWRAAWRDESCPTPVTLSYHLLRTDRTMMVFEGERTLLPTDVPAGKSVDVALRVRTPPAAGRTILVLDLVLENVTWFQGLGNRPVEVPLTVVRDTT
jgi:radical SAM protein with 4Fe4S-binding SPASM domain